MPDYSKPRNLPNVAEFEWEDDDDEREFFLICRQEQHNRSTDPKGHSDTLPAIRVPQGTSAQMMERVNDDRNPLRSLADFQRDAIIHHLAALDEWHEQDGYSPMVQVILANARAETYLTYTDMKKQTVTNTIDAIRTAIEAHDWTNARSAVDSAREVALLLDIDVRDLESTIADAENKLRFENR